MGKPELIRKKLDKTIQILTDLGMPKAQLNDRTALCLLALLSLKPEDKFINAKNERIGITPIMDFCKKHYLTEYAPNTRETFRRFSMHQLVQAGIALLNPDVPDRPTNSPKTVYQIAPDALELVQKTQTKGWRLALTEYNDKHPTLAARYLHSREIAKIPVTLGKKRFKLSPGNHNNLIKAIIEEFAPRFLQGTSLVYAGDTSDKSAYINMKLIKQLAIPHNEHGKLPDVIMFLPEKNWIVLVESVTSHGPMDSKRHQELSTLFTDSTAEIVYVTAFLNRSAFSKYASVIAWETEVWIKDNPDHLIHFNGTKFLGPY